MRRISGKRIVAEKLNTFPLLRITMQRLIPPRALCKGLRGMLTRKLTDLQQSQPGFCDPCNMNKTFLLILILVPAAVPSFVLAQKNGNAREERSAAVSRMIDDRTFTFHAFTMLPLRGGSRSLTGEYSLRVSGDSVISYLPYFGRAYSAPPAGDQGSQFTSVHNTYKITPRKKGGWDIVIKTDVVNDVREFDLTVFTNGSASLRVNSMNRDPISYNGEIRSDR